MKKLALIFAATASLAAPAFACPNSEHEAGQSTAKSDAPKADAKQDAAKADTKAAPAKADAKPTKDTQKKPDKVSSK
jgi:hypothetical protein